MSLYKIVEVVGTSEVSWDDAAKNALETASETLHDLRVAEVIKLDIKVVETKIVYRSRLSLSFRYMGGI